MFLNDGVDNVYRFMRTAHVTHPLDQALVSSNALRTKIRDIFAAAVEAKTLGAGLFSVDFCRDLEHFLVEFRQVILL